MNLKQNRQGWEVTVGFVRRKRKGERMYLYSPKMKEIKKYIFSQVQYVWTRALFLFGMVNALYIKVSQKVWFD